MNRIYEIFKQYRYKLTSIYLFMLFTELAIVVQPFLLGKSIDGLMIGTFGWVALLLISYMVSSFFNYKRMVYDTKVYTQIYNDIVLRFLEFSKEGVSKKIARTDMAQDIVRVLEGYVHYYISTIIVIFGSIWFIYLSNWRVGLIVTAAVFFILVVVLIFYGKIKQGINVRNDHYEAKVKSIQNGYDSSVSFFKRKRRLDIYESTLEGKNWFLVDTIKSVFLAISIVILVITSENVTAGSVITIYSYVKNFLESLVSIPVAFEMYSRLNNIAERIN